MLPRAFETGLMGGARFAVAALALGFAAPDAGQATSIAQVAAGFWHACALDDIGHVWYWGNNLSGQRCGGTTTDHWTPADVVFPGS